MYTVIKIFFIDINIKVITLLQNQSLPDAIENKWKNKIPCMFRIFHLGFEAG